MKKLFMQKATLLLFGALTVHPFIKNEKPQQMSESEFDASAGLNGGFEIVKNNLPVNWLFYTAKTIGKSADFDIQTDLTTKKEGKQSLRFNVRKCASTGGRLSPGFTRELPAKPNTNYRVRFWVRNEGSTFRIKISSVSAFKQQEGQKLETSSNIAEWKMYEYTYKIPDNMDKLRIEANVLSPGKFWIDGIEVEEVK